MPSSLLKFTGALLAIILAGSLNQASAANTNAGRLNLKFQFAPGPVAAGYTLVPADTVYDGKRGYGFEPGTKVTAVARKAATLPQSGFSTGEKPFLFSVALPEGNYKVTVTLGDAAGESETTIKAELRRLMLENVRTTAGQFATRSFMVNVRTTAIAGGGRVRIKAPRETVDEAWAWDERLTLEFNGKRPCLCALEIEKVQVPTVFVLGDSTVCDQSQEPYASWGQMLPRFFKPTVAVANHAESGESVRGANAIGRFAKIIGDMQPGDYLLIQFGHNDQKNKAAGASQKYADDLTSWISQVKKKGGTPVLITSMYRHRFEGNSLQDTLADYPEKMRAVAAAENVALIDLHAMSKELYEALGPEGSAQLFMHASPDSKNFDHTHHNAYGAYELARCVIEGLRKTCPELAKQITNDLPPFNPAKPDPIAEFKLPASPGYTTQRPLGD